MKLLVFNAKPYDQEYFNKVNKQYGHIIEYLPEALSLNTVEKAAGFNAVCVFVNDDVNADVIKGLKKLDVGLIALRCAGFNNVDLSAAGDANIKVVRVPAYSPNSVAEHAVALMLTLNRKTHKAYNRVRECNFSINGLMGFDLYNKTAGIIGTGRIGTELVKILNGFGMRILAYDLYPNQICTDLGVEYVSKEQLFTQSDIISLHCPLMPETEHLINQQALELMKPSVMLINTSRGAILDTNAVVDALRNRKIGYLGIDVYEQEAGLFFKDMSDQVISDVCLQQLLVYPNVLVTGHQAFFTHEAMTSIADTTLQSLQDFEQNKPLINQVVAN